MKKAATKAQQPPQPVSLGTKRQCPKCATKFYDFNKNELTCPKCKTEFNVQDLGSAPTVAPEPKKATRERSADQTLMQAEEMATDETPEFESVEDLGDDADDSLEDLEVEEEPEGNY